MRLLPQLQEEVVMEAVVLEKPVVTKCVSIDMTSDDAQQLRSALAEVIDRGYQSDILEEFYYLLAGSGETKARTDLHPQVQRMINSEGRSSG